MKNWERFEKDIARKLKGKRSPGSGNGNIQGDVQSDSLCIEMKETKNKSITFKIDWLYKIYKEAGQERKTPAFALEWGDGARRFMVLTYEDTVDPLIWTDKITIKLRPEDLEENTYIVVGSLVWKIVDNLEDY